MRIALAILLLGVVGCVSDDGYDTEARYYDNGVGYTDAEWRYEQQRRGVVIETYRYDPWYYPERSYHPRHYGGTYHTRPPYPPRPDTSYRDDDRDRVRDRDQQQDSRSGTRYPEDRAIERSKRPAERVDRDDRSRGAVGDIDRSRDRDQQRDRSRDEARIPREGESDRSRSEARPVPRPEPKPEQRTEPRGDRNVRDVENARKSDPNGRRGSGSGHTEDRIRRR